jgi:hypothetical protein
MGQSRLQHASDAECPAGHELTGLIAGAVGLGPSRVGGGCPHLCVPRACVRRTVAPEDGKSATLPRLRLLSSGFRTAPARHAKVVEWRPTTHARAALN